MSGYRIPSDYQNDVPKSNHNWSAPSYGTIHCGLAYPVKFRHLNTGDRFRSKPQILLQSNPMRGPLLNGFKLITVCTFTPDSVFYGWMRNGKRYSPEEYKDFTKFYFSPYAIGFPDGKSFGDKDPVFAEVRSASTLSAGLKQGYEGWISDIPVKNGSVYSSVLDHVGRGGLWDWLGVAPGFVVPNYTSTVDGDRSDVTTNESAEWNPVPAFCYFLSCYYYIANMQEEYMFYTRSAFEIYPNVEQMYSAYSFERVFNSLDPNVVLDDLTSLFVASNKGRGGDVFAQIGAPFATWLLSGLGGHGGLFSVPYRPDLFNNIIKVGESPTAAIPVIDGSPEQKGDYVSVPQLRMQTKVQNWLDRLFVSGGRFGDVLRTLWGTKSSPYINKPEFLGVWQASIDPSNVVASAAGSGSDGTVDLAQMAARIDRFSSFKGTQQVDYYAKEPGTVMYISMLVPEPSYCQGLNPDLLSGSFSDDFNPEMKGIGFLSVPRHRYSVMPEGFSGQLAAAWDSKQQPVPVDPNQVSVGDTVAWDWLRTDYPTLHGEFAQNGRYQYWTLVRQFTEVFSYEEPAGGDGYGTNSYYGTYINPLSWQYIFSEWTIEDPNFYLLSWFDTTVTSSVPSNYMPYLGR